MTLGDRLGRAKALLVAAGIATDEAGLDVELAAGHVLGWNRATLLAERNGPAPSVLEPAFSALIARRAAREPMAYVLGEREFWNLTFVVSDDVLVPRPESELIVEEALGLLRRQGRALVADIGTGSGCLAVSIAANAPAVRVVATDLSWRALAIARRNVDRHGVATRVGLVRTSMLEGLAGPFDLIVSNPPYVAEADAASLPSEVRHEPDLALFSGRDGLNAIRAVIDTAARVMAPSGSLVMEIGAGQSPSVAALVTARPDLQLTGIREDLQGIPRTVVVTRR